MSTFALHSLEGSTTAEQGGLVGESTLDNASPLVGGFDVETAAVFVPGGRKSIIQRVFIEGTTEGQTLTAYLELDDTEITLGTFSTAVGTKTVTEFAVNRSGYIAGVRLAGATIEERIEITEIAMDVYVPDGME